MKKVLIFLSILVILAPSFITPEHISAKTLGDLKRELTELEKEQNENEEQKQLTESQINDINKSIDSITTRIDQIDVDRRNIAEEIDNLTEDISNKDQEIKDIINFVQISNGESAYIEYAFGAKNFTDFIYRIAVSEQLTNRNNELIDEYNGLIEDNKNKNIELNQKENELESSQDDYEVKLKDLGKKLTQAEGIKLSLKDEIKVKKDAIAMYEELGCKDSNDINTCGKGKLPPDTSFWRPITKGYVTSEFSNRCYELNGKTKCDFHYATDIGSPTKAPNVYAAAAGVVSSILTRTNCGGNIVYIQHNIKGKLYTTQYAHLLYVKVKKNQVVTKETVIGIMGGNPKDTWWDQCTTGQHVHFGIIQGTDTSLRSKYVNPRNYVNLPAGRYNLFTDRTSKY